ncbi:hypothetical protein ACQEU6_32120 [Spirillospora sp. CA-108201]
MTSTRPTVSARTLQEADELFVGHLTLEVPSAEALNSKETGDSDTYTEED